MNGSCWEGRWTPLRVTSPSVNVRGPQNSDRDGAGRLAWVRQAVSRSGHEAPGKASLAVSARAERMRQTPRGHSRARALLRSFLQDSAAWGMWLCHLVSQASIILGSRWGGTTPGQLPSWPKAGLSESQEVPPIKRLTGGTTVGTSVGSPWAW